MKTQTVKSSRTSARKPASKMTVPELEELAKHFDREKVPTRPLGKKLRGELQRVGRPVGRPKVGEGSERVLVTIEGGLLRQADAYCEANQLKRAELIAIGLRKVLPKVLPKV